MKILILFLTIGSSGLFSQTHPFSNAWSYSTTAVTSDAEITATTVAGTGGTPTHTMRTIAIYIQSPNGRTSSAYDYPIGTSGQATTYLSLCGGGFCEDGLFITSTVGTDEICGQTSHILVLAAQSGKNAVAPWVKWSTPTSATLSSPSIAREGGSVTFTAILQKSSSCTEVSSVSCGWSSSPNNLMVSFSPNSSLPVNFTGDGGTVVWTIATLAGNPSSGLVIVGAGINNTPCPVNGSPGTSINLTVN